jgi:hypothetical protein
MLRSRSALVRAGEHDPEKLVLDLIGDGYRFSEKIMLG